MNAALAKLDPAQPAPRIILATLNAKYIHASLGLRYLIANMARHGGEDIRAMACLREFTIARPAQEIADALLAELGEQNGNDAQVIGFGVYIWNVNQTTAVVSTIRRLRPDITIILGGPEVSHETEQQAIVDLADFVITGEADLKFAEVCGQLLRGESPAQKIIHAPLPDMSQLGLPYDLYDDDDIAHRVIYVEASRGCPFTCEFCFSSLDVPVRSVELDAFLGAL